MRLTDNIIVRLVFYYTGSLGLYLGISWMFPWVPRRVSQERARNVANNTFDFISGTSSPTTTSEESLMFSDFLNTEISILVLMALVAAFMLTLPVIWVYRWTHEEKRFNQVFAHTLLLVPTAIALVVFLVKGSLALAFSLAGIVAAVRFRTTLKESLDAVYMFITIGIGLAAGVQLILVAFTASVFFNSVALFVWRTNCASRSAQISGWTIMERADSRQSIGKSEATRADIEGEKPFNAQLRIHTSETDNAQLAALPVLEANASRWQVAQIIQQADGSSIVGFDIRTRESADLDAFVHQIEESEEANIDRVELKQNRKTLV